MPLRIERGNVRRDKIEKDPSFAIDMKDENKSRIKKPSKDAALKISPGSLDCLPIVVDMILSMEGNIMAGETAATTVPIIAASRYEIFSSSGATSKTVRISKLAGKSPIKSAGLATVFSLLNSIDKLARKSKVTSARDFIGSVMLRRSP